jgi:hypothetical protein
LELEWGCVDLVSGAVGLSTSPRRDLAWTALGPPRWPESMGARQVAVIFLNNLPISGIYNFDSAR